MPEINSSSAVRYDAKRSKAEFSMFTAASSVINVAAILQLPQAFNSHFTRLSITVTIMFIVLHNSHTIVAGKIKVLGKFCLAMVPARQRLPARCSVFINTTVSITGRDWGKKRRLPDGSIVDTGNLASKSDPS